MPNNPVQIGTVKCGQGEPLTVIAGPCAIESKELSRQIAETLVRICSELNLSLIFKGSFDKANRTSLKSYRGVGIEVGLEILGEIQGEFGVPVTTDIHEADQAAAVAEVCDLIQIPAFLARQTDLVVAAGKTGKPVNVKKGQFMAPWDMSHVVTKLEESGCEDILLTERGTFFWVRRTGQ